MSNILNDELLQLFNLSESTSSLLIQSTIKRINSPKDYEPSAKEKESFHSLLQFYITLQNDIFQRVPREVMEEWTEKNKSSF